MIVLGFTLCVSSKNLQPNKKILLLHEISFSATKLFKFSNFYNSKLSLNISFICYHFMTTEIKTLLLKPVSIDAGLMDPCNQFTSNDIESGNFIIKHGINFR